MNLLKLKTIRKISLVDAGAAIGAKVAFMKNLKESTIMSLKEKILEAVTKAIGNALKPDTDASETPIEQLKIAIAGVAVEKQAVLYSKILEAVSKEGGDPQALLESALSDIPEDKRAAIMAAVAALHQAMPPPAAPAKPEPAIEPKVDGEPPKPDEEEPLMEKRAIEKIIKALSPELQTAVAPLLAFTKQQATTIDKLTKRVDGTETKLAGEIAEKQLSVELEVAKRFPFVPGDEMERAASLLAIRTDSGEEVYNQVVKSFDAANALAQKGLSASGSARINDRDDDDDSAHAQLCRMANELVEKTEKPITFPVAYARVAKRNKELHRKAALETRRVTH